MKIELILILGLLILPSSSQKLTDQQCVKDTPMVTYVDSLTQWWPPEAIAKGLGVPGYAAENPYNTFILAFWLSSGAADAAKVFSDASVYFGTDSPFGKTNSEIQQNIISKYHAAGQKLLVSAFGATENPTTGGQDPILTARSLAQFVINNNLDGVDLDWEDNAAMENGTGEQWLIDCTIQLRQLLPQGKYIITHAPQAPYFTGINRYKNGGYRTIHNKVGDLIDWYNIQFYNQGSNSYDSFESLFVESGNYFPETAINELIRISGVPHEKIVIGKPVTQADVVNTGLVDPRNLGQWANQYYEFYGVCFGVMTWQYSHDEKGLFPTYYMEQYV